MADRGKKLSKKIQTVVPDYIAEDIEKVISEDRFADQSEFIRHCIREYLNKRRSNLEKIAQEIINEREALELQRKGQDRILKVKNIIQKVTDINSGKAHFEEIIREAKKEGFNRRDLEYFIRRLRDYGEILELKEDIYRII